MHKLHIFSVAVFLINCSVSFASNTIDSIGVENNKGKKLIVHKVEIKETYYSISKKYSVNYKEVMQYNDSKLLQIGLVIKVPTNVDFASAPLPLQTIKPQLIQYTIKAKDNLNLLAEKYGTTANEIKRINNLTSINLQIGQILNIPNLATNITEEVVTTPLVTDKKIVTSEEVKNTVEKETTSTAPLTITEHTVKPKESLNSIAKNYATTLDELKRLNGLSSNNLSIGQVLKIPATNAKTNIVVEEKVSTTPIQKAHAKLEVQPPTISNPGFQHIVAIGETIYSIAKKYNLTTYQIITYNSLTSNEVSIGQKLIIRLAHSETVSDTEEESNGTNQNTIKDPTLRYAPSRYGLVQFEEKGTAVWIADQDLDPSKMLVLHRTAPVGTVIKVTNPMSNRTTYAKVVGKYTENETTKDVIIVMTKAVADAIGALDKRFFCNITYGAPANEQ